jgi:hypothetical protein
MRLKVVLTGERAVRIEPMFCRRFTFSKPRIIQEFCETSRYSRLVEVVSSIFQKIFCSFHKPRKECCRMDIQKFCVISRNSGMRVYFPGILEK